MAQVTRQPRGTNLQNGLGKTHLRVLEVLSLHPKGLTVAQVCALLEGGLNKGVLPSAASTPGRHAQIIRCVASLERRGIVVAEAETGYIEKHGSLRGHPFRVKVLRLMSSARTP